MAKNKNTYFIRRLIEEVGINHVSLFDPWSDFLLPEAENYIVRTTGVYHSDMDLLIAGSIQKGKIINPLPVLKRLRTKNGQYTWLEEENFPVLPWLNLKTTDLLTVEKFFRLYPDMIVKPLTGQGGWGVEKLNWGEFQSYWKKKIREKDTDYLIQPYKRDMRELRYFFVKGMEAVVLERKSTSGVAANFQQSGQASLTTLPSEFKPMLDRLVEASGAYYGAIDLFIQDHLIYILDFNSVPGVEQLEKVSGQNIIGEMTRRTL